MTGNLHWLKEKRKETGQKEKRRDKRYIEKASLVLSVSNRSAGIWSVWLNCGSPAKGTEAS